MLSAVDTEGFFLADAAVLTDRPTLIGKLGVDECASNCFGKCHSDLANRWRDDLKAGGLRSSVTTCQPSVIYRGGRIALASVDDERHSATTA